LVLLGASGAGQSSLLRAGLQVVMTLRSDFLGNLQAADLSVPLQAMSLPPLPMERIPEIIMGPAKMAELTVEESFVQAAMHNASSDDALPLLANLSPLDNAVRHAADEVLELYQPTPCKPSCEPGWPIVIGPQLNGGANAGWGWAQWSNLRAYEAQTRQFQSIHLSMLDLDPVQSLVHGLAAMARLHDNPSEALPLRVCGESWHSTMTPGGPPVMKAACNAGAMARGCVTTMAA
jgi:hypothetical protein